MRRSAVSSHPPLPSLDSIRITDLPALGHDAIHDLWRHLHRKPPPKGLAGELLVRALAYRIQITRQDGSLRGGLSRGGLSRGGEQRLAAAAREAARARIKTEKDAGEGDGSKAAASRTLRPGTRLLREWQGAVYEVVALVDGFLWNGTYHRSLSVIAKAITGTSWNGWLFFGVERKKKKVGSTHSLMPSSTPVKTALNEPPVDASSSLNAPSQAATSNSRLSASPQVHSVTKVHVGSISALPAAAPVIKAATTIPAAIPAASPALTAAPPSGRVRSRGVRFVSFDHAPAIPSTPTQSSNPPGGR